VLLMAAAAGVLLVAQVGEIALLPRPPGGAGAGSPAQQQRRLFTRASLAEYDGVRRPELYVAVLGEVFDVSSKRQFYGPPPKKEKDEAAGSGGVGGGEQGQGQGGRGEEGRGAGGGDGAGAGEPPEPEDPEIGYRVFVGRDGSRAFSTGEFTLSRATDYVVDAGEADEEEGEGGEGGDRAGGDDLAAATARTTTPPPSAATTTPNQAPLGPEELLELTEWLEFYRRTYPRRGVLAGGAFHDASGAPRSALARVRAGAARGKAARAERERRRLAAAAARPACETRWTEEEGAEVWCADGKGHPRRVQRTEAEEGGGEGGDEGGGGRPGAALRRRDERRRRERGGWRCVCFEEVGWSDLRQVYEGCSPEATRCKIV